MKIKVTLLGDSIRGIGYGTVVPRWLGEDFEVFQPDENCRFSQYTLRGLFDWEADMRGSRIVHWNNGLWDITNLFGDGLFTTEEVYVRNMLRIADILQSRYDKIIFATTTPVTENNPYNRNSDIQHYNEIIVPLLRKKGIVINDLYALVSKNIDCYIRKDDHIHLTEAGIEICAKQTTDLIRQVAQTLSPKEAASSDKKEETAAKGAPI